MKMKMTDIALLVSHKELGMILQALISETTEHPDNQDLRDTMMKVATVYNEKTLRLLNK